MFIFALQFLCTFLLIVLSFLRKVLIAFTVQAQALGLVAKRKIEGVARVYNQAEAIAAERDSLKSEVEELKARLAKSEGVAFKLAEDLKASKTAEEASQAAMTAMTSQLDKEAEEVKQLKSQLGQSADELKKIKGKAAEDASEAKKLKEKFKTLEHKDGTCNYAFASWAKSAEKEYCKALERFGAAPKPLVGNPSLGEEAFFKWPGEEFKYLPTLLAMCSDYGAVISTEATFNLLEGQGCNHLAALTDGQIAIDGTARDGLSAETKKKAFEFSKRYWMKYGRGEAKERAKQLLVSVCINSFFFLLYDFVSLHFFFVFCFRPGRSVRRVLATNLVSRSLKVKAPRLATITMLLADPTRMLRFRMLNDLRDL